MEGKACHDRSSRCMLHQLRAPVALAQCGTSGADDTNNKIGMCALYCVPKKLLPVVGVAHAGLGGLLILTIDLITEQGPAISLAYEPAEALVMERPPRDLTRDRLINGPLLRYSYLTAGILTVRLAGH